MRWRDDDRRADASLGGLRSRAVDEWTIDGASCNDARMTRNESMFSGAVQRCGRRANENAVGEGRTRRLLALYPRGWMPEALADFSEGR
jgi:hypothetical protein